LDGFLSSTEAAGGAEHTNAQGDGDAEQQAAQQMQPVPMELAACMGEVRQQQGDDQGQVGYDPLTAGFGREL
jgi:hypothetical protein